MRPVRLEEELSEDERQELARASEEVDTQGEKEDEEEERLDENLTASLRRYGEVVGTMQQLIAGHSVELDHLTALSDEERAALEELEQVLRARDRDGVKYIYAERRLERLNHSLAVLQPVLGQVLEGVGVDELSRQFDQVVDELNALRDRLDMLDEAEEPEYRHEKKKDEDDDDDDDDDEDEEDDEDSGDDGAAGGGAAEGGATGDGAAGDGTATPAPAGGGGGT